MLVLGGVDAADPAVRTHHGGDTDLFDERLERQRVQLPQGLLLDLDTGPEPFVLLVVDHEVLRHGDHPGVLSTAGYPASQARAATTSAEVPVSSVGCMTGAKPGEWLTGMSWATRPAVSALW